MENPENVCPKMTFVLCFPNEVSALRLQVLEAVERHEVRIWTLDLVEMYNIDVERG